MAVESRVIMEVFCHFGGGGFDKGQLLYLPAFEDLTNGSKLLVQLH
jgi:hypothetical protein